MKTQILHEDNDIIVIYKPEGLAAQSAKVTQPDVVSEICTYLKSPYVGLVHRLDQPVEGLMVLAKTKAAAGALSAQLTKGELKKTYLAVVSKDNLATDIPTEWTLLVDYLEKDAKAGKAQVVTSGGQEARLFYHKKADGQDNAALVEINLITGRFHQIRAQMAHADMPLLGDAKYGIPHPEVKSVALCAYKLNFFHPKTKEPMEFEIKPKKAIFNRYEI